MAARSSSTGRRGRSPRRRPVSSQSRVALVQWLALVLIGVLLVLAAFVLFGGGSSVLNP